MSKKKYSAIVLDTPYLGTPALFSAESERCRQEGVALNFADCTTQEDIIKEGLGHDVLLCCGNPPLTEEVFHALKRCKAVIRYGIGTNSVDLKAASHYGKVVYFMPGFCFEELVMHASAMILALLRNIKLYDSTIALGGWPKGEGPPPKRLSRLTVGLFGLGTSARPMSRVFKDGFLSKVIAYDPFVRKEIAAELGVELVSFEELLTKSDVISVHAPLSSSTHHAFNSEAFEKMKSSAIFINISRGPIHCDDDLIYAIKTGQIAGAGLDVFETEPLPADSPLRSMSNVILSPHTAFYGEESLAAQHSTSAELISLSSRGIVKRANVANPDVLEGLQSHFEII